MSTTTKNSGVVPPAVYSAVMTAGGAAAIGLAVYVAANATNIVSSKLMYHALVFGAFFGLYMVLPGGFQKNFNTPENKKMTVADVLYVTSVLHTTVGLGDVYPLTFVGRCAVSAHVGLVFLATAGLLPGLG